ncbi:hypothetical protein PANO111632_02740 [Paracoccus nototheniae]|uniref:Uncharacterized protein n=1 Tax=Paracoccus nototheniae TaxID=2489002 RepID=A0ABW4DZ77_9RHOB|nr:hypothetical protein [Paracoccus nototheniae]
MSDEWGPWIEHDGESVPNLGRAYLDAWVWCIWERAERRAPEIPPERVQFWSDDIDDDCWIIGPNDCSLIVRYRIRRPRALLQLIEMVESLPDRQPVREDA